MKTASVRSACAATAAALGVKAMSLYNHVQNKDALLDGMVEEVVAKIELPKSQMTWQDFLRYRCQSAYQVLKQHAWASQLFIENEYRTTHVTVRRCQPWGTHQGGV